MRYIIVGNSAAGIGGVEGIRKMDKDGEITVITKEPYHTYSRPLISYLLKGKVTEETINYRPKSFYDDNGCRLLNTTAASVDYGSKQIVLENGDCEPYDKLLVACGASPFIPDTNGLDSVENCFTFTCLDDAKRLKGVIDKSKRVLIIGSGLIGLKCAEGVRGEVSQVVVVTRGARILSSVLDEAGALLVRRHLESKGIDFKMSSFVKEFKSNSAILNDNSVVDFDILILASGIRPNVDILSGIADIDKGILVNEKSETTASDIYAAGDCTQTLDVSSGDKRIMALLPNAYMQGECAGINMAGGNKVFDKAIPMNAIGFFGLNLITAGCYDGDVYADDRNGNYKRLFYKDNRLKGYILIGRVERAGIYTSLIRERTPLDSIDFEVVCEGPGLMAFTREERMVKLGGEVV